MHPAWTALLIFTTWYAQAASFDSAEPRFFAGVRCILGVCFVNLEWQLRWLQKLAHDAYVSLLLHALAVSTCSNVRTFGLVTSALQLLTRWWYGRCLFLWWNTERNVDNDVAIVILCAMCLWRRGPLVPTWWCVLLGIVTHCLPDDRQHSLAMRM